MSINPSKIVESVVDFLAVSPVLAGKVTSFFDLNFMSETNRISYPAVGVSYLGMSSDNKGTGRAATLFMDIYIIGDTTCLNSKEKMARLWEILTETREALLCQRNDVVGGHRVWRFIHEVPIDVDGQGSNNRAAYRQRFSTVVVL